MFHPGVMLDGSYLLSRLSPNLTGHRAGQSPQFLFPRSDLNDALQDTNVTLCGWGASLTGSCGHAESLLKVVAKKNRFPLRVKDAEIEECSEDELEYLAGFFRFFDGDGCVNLMWNNQAPNLPVFFKGADTLLRF